MLDPYIIEEIRRREEERHGEDARQWVYGDLKQCDLTFTITPGDNQIDLRLKS